MAVACGNDGQFRRLAAVLGKESLADDERYVTNAARVAHRPELVGDLEALLAADPAEAWAQRLAVVGVPAGKVGTVADGLALAESLGLDPLVDVGPDAPRQVRHPITYSETPVTRYAALPRLGEHSEEIRRWLAGG
jgi:formyl-CoA transferase